ncbi:MAG: hypothetical protein EP343_03510 [Deltaproteobacteria bacterium]|nr:MAG: hypothetical protein EP343_03510 [Deltaproteobacteria bacterium]
MTSPTNPRWWDAQHVLNRLRLQLVRDRHSKELRQFLNEDGVLEQLQVALTQASTAPTSTQALEEVEAWIEEQKAGSRYVYLYRQLFSSLRAVLETIQPPQPPSPSVSQRRKPIETPMPGRRFSQVSSVSRHDSVEVHVVSSRDANPAVARASGEHSLPSFSATSKKPQTVTDMPYVTRTLRGEISSRRSGDTVEESKGFLWWDSGTVVDSMRLRLESLPVGAPLRRLLLVSDFFSTLLGVLKAMEGMPDFVESQRQVAVVMERYCNKLNFQVPLADLWSLLQPLLNLKRVSSTSITSCEIPWLRLREIEAQEKQHTRPRKEKVLHSEELWDWDDENKDIKNFATGAVSQLIEATRSSDNLKAPSPSSIRNLKPPITSSK